MIESASADDYDSVAANAAASEGVMHMTIRVTIVALDSREDALDALDCIDL